MGRNGGEGEFKEIGRNDENPKEEAFAINGKWVFDGRRESPKGGVVTKLEMTTLIFIEIGELLNPMNL